MACNFLLLSLIIPKKGDVKQQHMGFEMSLNSIKDNMQKGTQIEVNLPTLAYFLIILYVFVFFSLEIWVFRVQFDGAYAIYEWKCQNRWFYSVSANLGGEIEVNCSIFLHEKWNYFLRLKSVLWKYEIACKQL